MINYLSTKEMSKSWGISPRRISKLASEGRIEGATRFGKAWMIPEDAAKPVDFRKNNTKSGSDSNRYCFPYILFSVHSEEQVLYEFSTEEKVLYDACIKYEKGKFEECLTLTDKLVNSLNRHIRIGALYLKSYCYIELKQFDRVDICFIKYRSEIDTFKDCPYEIRLLLNEFTALFQGAKDIADNMKVLPVDAPEIKCIPYVCVMNIFATVSTMNSAESIATSINSHEIECMALENQGYMYAAMLMHFYLSVIYVLIGDSKLMEYHIVKSVELSLELKTHVTLFSLIGFTPVFESVLRNNFPCETVDTIQEIGAKCVDAHTAYIKACGGTSVFANLTARDLLLVDYVMQGFTVKSIAKHEHRSETTVKRDLKLLYEKVGVNSKRGLAEKAKALFWNMYTE